MMFSIANTIFRSKKKFLVNLLCLFIPLFIISFIIMLFNYENYIYEKNIVNNIKNRELKVFGDLDSCIDILKNNDYVIDYYPLYDDISLYDLNGEYYIGKYIPIGEIKSLNNQDLELEEDEIIINDKEPYNIGDVVKLKYSNKIYKFVVSDKCKNNEDYVFLSNYFFENNNLKNDNAYTLIISDSKYLNKVLNLLEENNINGQLKDYTYMEEMKKYSSLLKYLNYIKYFLFILLICIFLVLMNKIIKEDMSNINLLKILGYHNISIYFIVYLRFVYILLLSFGLLFFICLFSLFNNILRLLFFKNMFEILIILFVLLFFSIPIIIFKGRSILKKYYI